MNNIFLLLVFLLVCSVNSQDNGLAPEVTDLNAEDVSFQKEKELKYLKNPYISLSPRSMKDEIPVGALGNDGGNIDKVLAFVDDIVKATDEKHRTDSLLINYKGKLIFESYFRRGRVNYPHYQMSITKSYTAFALGRAIQLGYLTMEDVDKPAINFLKEVDRSVLIEGADKITIHQAMHMSSGIRLDQKKAAELRKKPELLKGQKQIQTYMQYSSPLVKSGRIYKYQASDPAITMQVVESVVPGKAEDFIRNEFLGKMGITNYGWQYDTSGLPKSAAGSSFRSRDMIKMGMLVLNKGKWKGQQLIPEAFVEKATSPITLAHGPHHYGYFWWNEKVKIADKTYEMKSGRGAGGQFIMMLPELELIVVVTAHNKGMGTMLKDVPAKLIPAFLK